MSTTTRLYIAIGTAFHEAKFNAGLHPHREGDVLAVELIPPTHEDDLLPVALKPGETLAPPASKMFAWLAVDIPSDHNKYAGSGDQGPQWLRRSYLRDVFAESIGICRDSSCGAIAQVNVDWDKLKALAPAQAANIDKGRDVDYSVHESELVAVPMSVFLDCCKPVALAAREEKKAAHIAFTRLQGQKARETMEAQAADALKTATDNATLAGVLDDGDEVQAAMKAALLADVPKKEAEAARLLADAPLAESRMEAAAVEQEAEFAKLAERARAQQDRYEGK